MSARLGFASVALLCALGLIFSCHFEPDLSRFEPCAEDGACPTGYTCLAEARRCLPDCGAAGPCSTEPPDASTDGGMDGGMDGGTDAGMDAGPPLVLVTATLLPAIEGLSYTAELQAQGGTPPYAFRATEPLPQGLTLDAGILSGTLMTPGTYDVAVEVSDTATSPAHVSRSYDLRVREKLLVAGPSPLVDGYSGKQYTEDVSAIGGVPPYRFTLDGGSLPSELSLLLNGSIAGTPSGTGSYSFGVKVVDSDPQQPQSALQQLELTITTTPLGAAISNNAVPDGRVGTAYQYTLRVSSGSLTWSIESGSLPGGLTLGTNGVISGTPGERGSFTFKARATDGVLTNPSKSFTMKVH